MCRRWTKKMAGDVFSFVQREAEDTPGRRNSPTSQRSMYPIYFQLTTFSVKTFMYQHWRR
jgi:hypothetical protein